MKNQPALYVHVPFCRSRCHYCTFASTLYSPGIANIYLDALTKERSRVLPPGFTPSSLFIGGGTPSSLSLRQLEQLLDTIPFPGTGGEATIEMNPDSADPEKLALARKKGINRISFGVQTFDPAGLRLLGRRHEPRDAEIAIKRAVAAGFESINLDLITAWPGQDRSLLESDLAKATLLGVSHISVYNVIIEDSSKLRQTMTENHYYEQDEDAVRRIWEWTADALVERGFKHYEISNFAKPGFECKHNINTWKGGEYYGLGMAAHSHIGEVRFANIDTFAQYIDIVEHGGDPVAFREKLDDEAKAKETASMWLRMQDGIDSREFFETTGIELEELYKDELPALLADGLLIRHDRKNGGYVLEVNPEYWPVLDAILVDLV